MTEERRAYLALALTPGIGRARLHALERRFGSWTAALAAPAALAAAIPRFGSVPRISERDPGAVDRVVDAVSTLGGFVLAPFDPGFPVALTMIDDPPPILFGWGRAELLAQPSVAIVGTRHPTAYGIAV